MSRINRITPCLYNTFIDYQGLDDVCRKADKQDGIVGKSSNSDGLIFLPQRTRRTQRKANPIENLCALRVLCGSMVFP